MNAIFVVFGLCLTFLVFNRSDGLICYVCPGAAKITECPKETCPEGDTMCLLGGFHDMRVYGACVSTSVCKPGPLPGPFPPCGYCCEGSLCNNHTCFG